MATTIDSLDDALISRIVNLLSSISDMAVAARVCRRWRAIFGMATRFLCKYFSYIEDHTSPLLSATTCNFDHRDLLDFYTDLPHLSALRLSTSLSSLTISISRPTCSLLSVPSLMDRILPSLTSLRTLCMSGSLDKSTLAHLQQLPFLQSLSLSLDPPHCHGEFAHCLVESLNCLPALLNVHLDISLPRSEGAGVMESLVSHVSSLRFALSLKFQPCNDLSSSICHLTTLTQLQALSLSGLDFDRGNFSAHDLHVLLKLSSLTRLEIDEYWAEENPRLSGFYARLHLLPRLQSLAVVCWDASDAEAVSTCTALTHLTLEQEGEFIDHNGVCFRSWRSLRLLESLSWLKSGCDGNQVRELARALPGLKRLSVEHLFPEVHHCEFLSRISQFNELTSLHLSSVHASARMYRRLSNLPSLRLLSLECQLDAKILRDVGALEFLEEVDLSCSSRVTAEELEHLNWIPTLKCVRLSPTLDDKEKAAIPRHLIRHY